MQRMLVFILCVFAVPVTTIRADQANYDKHEQIYKSVLKALSDLADALESVKDMNTARQAAPKVEDVCNRLKKIVDDVKKLTKLEAEERKKLDAAYLPELQKVSDRLQNVALQAGVSAGGEAAFTKALKSLETVADSLKAIGKSL